MFDRRSVEAAAPVTGAAPQELRKLGLREQRGRLVLHKVEELRVGGRERSPLRVFPELLGYPGSGASEFWWPWAQPAAHIVCDDAGGLDWRWACKGEGCAVPSPCVPPGLPQ